MHTLQNNRNSRLDETLWNSEKKIIEREFYTTYKNSTDTIDDPIFTGFTFDIDDVHSPLFYSISGDSIVETLKNQKCFIII